MQVSAYSYTSSFQTQPVLTEGQRPLKITFKNIYDINDIKQIHLVFYLSLKAYKINLTYFSH